MSSKIKREKRKTKKVNKDSIEKTSRTVYLSFKMNFNGKEKTKLQWKEVKHTDLLNLTECECEMCC